MRTRLQRLAGSGITHVAFAFCAMGGWAMFANREYPLSHSLLAGVVQGTLSACLTLFLKTAIEQLSKRFSGTSALWAPPLVACMASSAILATIHALSGTPEILKTIAVPLAVSTTYAAIYNYSLYQKGERA
jgi:mannose/fructose/N-acetylgalactosamine-specific phosphotransferase system component IIC